MGRLLPDSYVGPLFSACGFRSWEFWISDRAIHAVAHSHRRMLRLALSQHLGFPPDPQQGPAAPGARDRIYPVGELRAVTVANKLLSASELVVTLGHRTAHLYGIYDRSRLDQVRRVLRERFPDLYAETGFASPLAAVSDRRRGDARF